MYSLWNQEHLADGNYVDILVGGGSVMTGEDPLCSQVCSQVEIGGASNAITQDINLDQCGTFSQDQFEPRLDVMCSPTTATGMDCFESASVVGSDNMYAEQVVQQYSEPRPESKPEEYIIYKSLNYMPFTTRFHMLQSGSTMKLVDNNPRQSVVITDKKPPAYSNKQR